MIPKEVITRLVENVNAFKEWKETCDALCITGLQLRASENVALPRRYGTDSYFAMTTVSMTWMTPLD